MLVMVHRRIPSLLVVSIQCKGSRNLKKQGNTCITLLSLFAVILMKFVYSTKEMKRFLKQYFHITQSLKLYCEIFIFLYLASLQFIFTGIALNHLPPYHSKSYNFIMLSFSPSPIYSFIQCSGKHLNTHSIPQSQ